MLRSRTALALVAAGSIWGISGSVARADGEKSTGRPLLLGGAVQPKKPVVRLDPVLPSGALRRPRPAPLMKDRRCSLRRPVCVGPGTTDGAHLAQALSHLERAYEELKWGAGLGLSEATFLRPLVWRLDERSRLVVEAQPRPSRGFDRAWPNCAGGDVSLESARRCVAASAVVERAPATAPWLREGFAARVSQELGASPRADFGCATSRAHPEAGVLTSSTRAPTKSEERGAWVSPLRSARFFAYLERRSRGQLGQAGYLALTLAATETAAGQPRYDAEPDLADVIWATLEGDRIEIARFFDDFAQDSFFEQSAGRPMAVSWDIDGATLPRRVAFPTPIEPTGSVYARITLPRQMRSEVFGFRMSCETPVSYVWSVARVDERGREISRFPITFQERAADASGRVLPVDGLTELLVAGTNLGGVALTHPFDPDHEPHEAHACTLTINVVPAAGAASPAR